MSWAHIGRAVAAAALLGALPGPGAWAWPALRLPFLHRGSSAKIETWIFWRSENLDLATDRIGVFEVPLPLHTAPTPPRFGELFYQTLLARDAAKQVVYLESIAWDLESATAAWRMAAAAQYAREHRLDAVALARVDALFVRSSGGLILEITLRVVSAKNGEVLWYGKKRAYWSRYTPLEDCFRTVAESFRKELTG
ncbi:MAG TPA: hypothetical protein VEU62_07625 [Bryobacterales bacterium]|nr:hypothetical protein [Bryobacterales bacterium]